MEKFAESKKIAFKKGFSILELLIVIAIIGLLVSIAAFGLAGARESARDGRRRSDLESIKSAIELYRADCGRYPASLNFGGSLAGSGTPTRCSASNQYMRVLPQDPTSGRSYRYSVNANGTTYELCAALEQTGLPSQACGGSTTCGSATCNLRVVQ